MIKDIRKANKDVTPNDKEMAILRENFPSCFGADGSFDIVRFSEFLKNKVEITHEGYELKFLGKNYARLLSALETETVIVPDESHNSLPENENSGNIYITGDNIDGLKHLLKSYAGKIKCIYIDPPYNTGSDDFVYKDNFNLTKDELADKLSIDEEQAQRILDFTRSDSASHSAWLMFIYPRLQLARDLLADDGVIFISIDDNEQGNLKIVCDEIFGESNFVENLIWKRIYGGKIDSKWFAHYHDYIVVYAKNKELWHPNLLPRSEDAKVRYKNPDNDPRGSWKAADFTGAGSTSTTYPITSPSGKIFYPPTGKHWIASKENYERLNREGRLWFGANGDSFPSIKRFLSEVKEGVPQTSILDYSEVGHTDEANRQLKSLMEGKFFDYPKPVRLLYRLSYLGTNKNDIILDFFSGSATTAHAVMQLNAEDGGSRKFIMVQLPEKVKDKSEAKKAGYETIDQIGRKRIIRAAKKIRSEHPDTTADLGFKHYTLQEVSQTTLDKMERFDNTGFLSDTTIYDEFGTETILTTWLVHDGYGFTARAEKIDLNGYTAYWCGKHLYLINPGISEDAIKALVDRYNSQGDFNPPNIIAFGYNFSYVEMENLKTNVRILRDSEKNLTINVDVRY